MFLLLYKTLYIFLVLISVSWSYDEDLHYAIVVDAGSSGSRTYLYKWPKHSGNAQDLLKISPLTDAQGEPLVKSVSPGLSSFGENPQARDPCPAYTNCKQTADMSTNCCHFS